MDQLLLLTTADHIPLDSSPDWNFPVKAGLNQIEGFGALPVFPLKHLATRATDFSVTDDAVIWKVTVDKVTNDPEPKRQMTLSDPVPFKDLELWKFPGLYTRFVLKCPDLVRFVANPPASLQLAIFKKMAEKLHEAEDRDIEASLVDLFDWINPKPCEEALLWLAGTYPKFVATSREASPRVRDFLLSTYPKALKYLTHTTDAERQRAVAIFPRAIEYLHHSSSEVQLLAAKRDASVCPLIKNIDNDGGHPRIPPEGHLWFLAETKEKPNPASPCFVLTDWINVPRVMGSVKEEFHYLVRAHVSGIPEEQFLTSRWKAHDWFYIVHQSLWQFIKFDEPIPLSSWCTGGDDCIKFATDYAGTRMFGHIPWASARSGAGPLSEARSENSQIADGKLQNDTSMTDEDQKCL